MNTTTEMSFELVLDYNSLRRGPVFFNLDDVWDYLNDAGIEDWELFRSDGKKYRRGKWV